MEQFLVSNSGAGRGNGGQRWTAGEFLTSVGAMKEDIYRDTGTNGTPVDVSKITTSFKPVANWGIVDPQNEVPSVADIKKALSAYGPITPGLFSTDAFHNYKTGVFDEGATDGFAHAIIIVGWDDSIGVWIIRNSWGTGWGNNAGYGTENGYA